MDLRKPRIACWLDCPSGSGHTVTIAHAAVVRVALLVVMRALPAAYWRIDTLR